MIDYVLKDLNQWLDENPNFIKFTYVELLMNKHGFTTLNVASTIRSLSIPRFIVSRFIVLRRYADMQAC